MIDSEQGKAHQGILVFDVLLYYYSYVIITGFQKGITNSCKLICVDKTSSTTLYQILHYPRVGLLVYVLALFR